MHTARHVCHMCAQLPAPRRTQLLTHTFPSLEGLEKVQVQSLGHKIQLSLPSFPGLAPLTAPEASLGRSLA